MLRFCSVGDVFLWCVVFCGCGVLGGSATEEATQRTIDNIDSFLHSTDFALTQFVQAFALGFIASNVTVNSSTNFFEPCNQMLTTQLLAQDEIGAIYVYVNGQFLGASRQNNTFITTQPLFGASCANAVPYEISPDINQTLCAHFYLTNDYGQPVTYTGSLLTNRMFKFAPQHNNVTWTNVLKITTTSLGIAKSAPLYDTNGNTIGFVSVAMSLSKLSDFLVSAFGGESDLRVVYIAERESNNLIAASAGAVTTVDAEHNPVQINAANSSIALIRESSVLLHEHQEDSGTSILSFIDNGFYIQATEFYQTGFGWHVVVVRPVEVTNDIISTSSTTFYVLAVMASLSIFLSVLLMLWVMRFWKLQLWKAAQPPLMIFILIANILSASCTFVLSGVPSTSLCLARQWMVVLAVTLTCGAFLAKLLRVYFTTRTKHLLKRNRTVHITSKHVIMLVLGLVVFQVCLLVLWTKLDPMEPYFSYSVTDGVASGVEQCKSSHSWGMISCATFVALLIAGGSYLAYTTRDVSETLAESRAVMMTFYHGAFIGAVLLFVGLFANVSTKSFLLFVILAMIWFGTTTQAALFLPRVYRQVTLGDLTQWEVKEMAVHHLNKQYMVDNPNSHARAGFGVHPHASGSLPFPSEYNRNSQRRSSQESIVSKPNAALPVEEMYVI